MPLPYLKPPTQAELDQVLADIKPLPPEVLAHKAAQRKLLHRWAERGYVQLGPGLTWVLRGTPGGTDPWP